MPIRYRTAVLVLYSVFVFSACGEYQAAEREPPPATTAASDGGGTEAAQPSGEHGGERSRDVSAAAVIPAPDPADYPGMDEQTSDGAEQAFRYYIAAMIWAMQTGDGDPHASLFGSSCKGCRENADQVAELRSAHRFWSATGIEDVDLSSGTSERYDVEVDYLFALSPHSEPDSAGKRVEIPRTEYVSRGGLTWSGAKWRVEGLGMRWSENEHG